MIQTMYNNQRLRWNKDSGIYIPMLEDKSRNQFYDRILSLNVKDKNCVEVGFGTGFLSLLAIKHGAKHVRAYEYHPDRYELGKHLIKKLNLETKIQLINEYFKPELVQNEELLFHEIINPNIWGDGIYNILKSNIKIIPEKYGCDFYAVPISGPESDKLFGIDALEIDDDQIFVNFYNKVKAGDWPECNNRNDYNKLPQWIKNELTAFNCSYVSFGVGKYNFNPGVDIDTRYIKEIETFVNQFYELPTNKKVIENENFLPRSEYRDYILRGKKITGYCLDSNFTNSDSEEYIYLNVPIEATITEPILILPCYYVEANGYKLQINLEPGSCWIPPYHNALIQNSIDSMTIRQCLRSGEIRYWID